jgi:striatin 1/3/4
MRTNSRSATRELEPVITYRGHTAPVTCVVVSSALNALFSSSMDSTIRVWKMPTSNTEPYGQYDASTTIQTLEGHTDAVWDIVLLPSRDGSTNKKEDRLVSISADGSLKVWKREGKFWSLLASHSLDGAIPTCLSLCSRDYAKVFIGFTNGLVKLWDVEAGEEVMSFGETSEGEMQSSRFHNIC